MQADLNVHSVLLLPSWYLPKGKLMSSFKQVREDRELFLHLLVLNCLQIKQSLC